MQRTACDRGTTSVYRIKCGLGGFWGVRPKNPGAVSGAPVVAYCWFGKPLRTVFTARVAAASHRPAALWGYSGGYLCSSSR